MDVNLVSARRSFVLPLPLFPTTGFSRVSSVFTSCKPSPEKEERFSRLNAKLGIVSCARNLNSSQNLSHVHNALGVSYTRDGQLSKGITQFEKAVKLQPGYLTAWNNLGDAYEKKDLKAALRAFEEVLLFDPNNKVAKPRRDALRDRVRLYKGVPLKSDDM